MNRATALAVTLFALGLGACDGTDVSDALAPVAVPDAHLTVVRDVQINDFSVQSTITNACTGEDVAYDIQYHQEYRSMTTPDGMFRFNGITRSKGEAVGLTSGRVYRYQNVSPIAVALVAGYKSTLVQHLRLLSAGDEDNMILRVLIHQTVDASGHYSAYISHIEIECRG